MDKHNYYQTLISYVDNSSKTVDNMKEELKLLEKKEKYLRDMALLHQENCNSLSDIPKVWETPSDKPLLNNKVLSDMESMMSQCELVSGNQDTTPIALNMALERDIAEDLDEENVDDPNNEKEVKEVAVRKLWQVKGKVDEISYSLTFDGVSSSEEQEELQEHVDDIQIIKNNDLELLCQLVIDTGDMETFTLQMHNYQILVHERIEAMDELKNFENMEIQRSEELVQFRFVPIEDHELNVIWKIVWDNRNYQFINLIKIDCTEDVLARFSQKKEAFPYISGNKQLSNKKQVLQFFGSFVDDLLENSIEN